MASCELKAAGLSPARQAVITSSEWSDEAVDLALEADVRDTVAGFAQALRVLEPLVAQQDAALAIG